MEAGEKLVARYILAATELAESMHNDIHHYEGVYSEKTIKMLNAFIIESNSLKDFTDGIVDEYTQFNN